MKELSALAVKFLNSVWHFATTLSVVFTGPGFKKVGSGLKATQQQKGL